MTITDALPLVLVPTYARTSYLQEQLACLLAQDSPCQVLVLNDCPRQALHFAGEATKNVSVQVINYPPFNTLGEKRNRLLAMAGSRLAMWADDDDWCFPWYVRSLVTAASRNRWGICYASWCRWKEWKTIGWRLSCAGPADQWLMKGGAPALDCGEDFALHTIVRNQRPGTYLGPPGYIFRWGQGTFHLSGKWEPKGGVEHHADAERRLDSGEEPEGDVYLTPIKPDIDAPADLLPYLDPTNPLPMP